MCAVKSGIVNVSPILYQCRAFTFLLRLGLFDLDSYSAHTSVYIKAKYLSHHIQLPIIKISLILAYQTTHYNTAAGVTQKDTENGFSMHELPGYISYQGKYHVTMLATYIEYGFHCTLTQIKNIHNGGFTNFPKV
jgi:hypothetical protein